MKIAVLGGGTAGLVTATILKEALSAEVAVIYSDKIDIIGVGEGSTEHFMQYMNFIGIDQYTVIKECDATYKSAILFEGWTEKPYMHYVGPPFSEKVGQYNYIYGRQVSDNYSDIVPRSLFNNKINKWFLNRPDEPPFNQFHFNTYKLNNFLKKVSLQKGISLIEDKVVDVIFDESENISHLIGEKQEYHYDFYIDATGFKKVLIGKMGAKWKSFGEYLKMKSAITFQTPPSNEYNIFTTAKAMDYGWAFSLPVWERQGNGYIFDSDYITFDDAKEEVLKKFRNVTFGKEFSFDAGYLDTPWIKNCVAMGLSAAFVEPLEATSIGTTIQESFILMHLISNYSEKNIEKYNSIHEKIMNNIRDFIFLHYMVNKDDTVFWRDIAKIDPPESLKEKLELWSTRLPIYEDFAGDSNYNLFFDYNFIVVMHGLRMFDQKEIKKEFDSKSMQVKNIAKEKISQYEFSEIYKEKAGHKEFISLIRDFL